MARIGQGWDGVQRVESPRDRYPRLWRPGDEPDTANCLHCGHPIEPPVEEVFWCREGCKRGWELALAQQRLLECDEAPRTPLPGYPLLMEEPCDES